MAGSIDAPDFVVVDVDTSCSQAISICQIGIVGFKDGRETFAYESLLDPCDRFSSFNTRIHGITVDHVMGAPTFADAHAIIAGHLSGRITVAHSLFDKGALAAACLIHQRDPIEATWLDSVRVAKRAWPDLPSHRLNVLTDFLGLPYKHHDALSDARAAGMVIVRAMEHTGMALAGWLAPSNPPRAKAPPPALEGPLKGGTHPHPRRGPQWCFSASARGRGRAYHGVRRCNHYLAGHQQRSAVRPFRHRPCPVSSRQCPPRGGGGHFDLHRDRTERSTRRSRSLLDRLPNVQMTG